MEELYHIEPFVVFVITILYCYVQKYNSVSIFVTQCILIIKCEAIRDIMYSYKIRTIGTILLSMLFSHSNTHQ